MSSPIHSSILAPSTASIYCGDDLPFGFGFGNLMLIRNEQTDQTTSIGVTTDTHSPANNNPNETRAIMQHYDGVRKLTKTVGLEANEFTLSVLDVARNNKPLAVLQMNDEKQTIEITNAYAVTRSPIANAIKLGVKETRLDFSHGSKSRSLVFDDNGIRMMVGPNTVWGIDLEGNPI